MVNKQYVVLTLVCKSMNSLPWCTFMSRSDAQEYKPDGPAHLISISDGLDDQAAIVEGRWKSVTYHHFVDAGFDEETIALYGDQFELRYADYLLADKATILRVCLLALVSTKENIVIHCQAGRSRSAAVALYLKEHHGYRLEKPAPDANICVYRMLVQDEDLLSAYAIATQPVDAPEALSRFGFSLKGLARWIGFLGENR